MQVVSVEPRWVLAIVGDVVVGVGLPGGSTPTDDLECLRPGVPVRGGTIPPPMVGHGRTLELGSSGSGHHATSRRAFIPVHGSTEGGSSSIDSSGNKVSCRRRDPIGEWNYYYRDSASVDPSAPHDHRSMPGRTTASPLLLGWRRDP